MFEEEGWTTESHDKRTLLIRRDSGSPKPVAYRLGWTGNDGTFSAPSSISLPLGHSVPVTISVAPRALGIHSAILNVLEPVTQTIVSRSMTTVVVPARFDTPDYSIQFDGRLHVMQRTSSFWEVPLHIAALGLDLTVTRGAVRATIAPSVDSQYMHKYPWSLDRTLTPGTYHFVIADPSPGVWGLSIGNLPLDGNDPAASNTNTEAAYSFAVRALDASLSVSGDGDGNATVVVANRGAQIGTPTVVRSFGSWTSHRGEFRPDGVTEPFEINVPPNSTALIVNGRMLRGGGQEEEWLEGLDLYLYDCTTGECFSHDAALFARREQRLVVRRPSPGRWVAIVSKPRFPSAGSYLVDILVASAERGKKLSLSEPLPHGTRRTLFVDRENAQTSSEGVELFELFDDSLEQAQTEHAWVDASDLAKMTGRPTALAFAVRKRFATSTEMPTPRPQAR
jgi:hypothetical protein